MKRAVKVLEKLSLPLKKPCLRPYPTITSSNLSPSSLKKLTVKKRNIGDREAAYSGSNVETVILASSMLLLADVAKSTTSPF